MTNGLHDGPLLPPPLAAALTEFEAWMQGELLADRARSTPKAALYHYTGVAERSSSLAHSTLLPLDWPTYF